MGTGVVQWYRGSAGVQGYRSSKGVLQGLMLHEWYRGTKGTGVVQWYGVTEVIKV
jgi:hypothetical protein